jgi:hypothetical protein
MATLFVFLAPNRRSPAAATRCRCRPATSSTASDCAAVPAGSSRRSSAWGASGAPSGSSGRRRASTRTAVGYAGGYTPNPTYREVCSGMTDTPRSCWWSSIPKVTSYDEMLKLFWESHDPTQGMRRATTSAPSTAPPSTRRRTSSATKAARRAMFQDRLTRGLRPHHHGDRAGAAVLLRRGLSPAVSGQESQRLLRAGRHGCLVPDWRERVAAHEMT